MFSANTRELPWQELYRAAVLETNREKTPEQIQETRAAIDVRLREFQLDHGGTPEEQLAIQDALRGLKVLEREIQEEPHREG